MTNTKTRVAISQVESSADPEINLAKAGGDIRAAAAAGAKAVVFPEYFMAWKRGGWPIEELRAVAQPIDGSFVKTLSHMASEAGIWVIAGIVESAADPDAKPFNTTVVLDASGGLRSAYRKSHLFDAFKHRESDSFGRGTSLFTPIETPLGVTGLFVCYELRFPEVARRQALAGATSLIVPSAWVQGPMKDAHWHTLLRARAIENGCFVIAAAQAGNEFCGQSVILDPMGAVVSQGAEEECLIYGEIDPRRLERVRETVPSLAHRRPELYE